MARPVLDLLGLFGSLSLITIGGGQTIIAAVQRQSVEVHGWMTSPEFLDAFAISRMAPGPGSLLATLIGWRVAGTWGAVAATVGIFGPATLLIYAVATIWSRHNGKRWQRAIEQGLRPVAAGMLLASVYVLLVSLQGGWLARAVTFASAAFLTLSRVNPLFPLLTGMAVFVLTSPP